MYGNLIGKSPGFVQFGVQSRVKCTEIWSEKASDLSHFGPIWPTLETNLPSLLYTETSNTSLGCQISAQSRSDNDQNGQIRDFSDSISVHFVSLGQNDTKMGKSRTFKDLILTSNERVQKSDLIKSSICRFGGNLTHFGPKSDTLL